MIKIIADFRVLMRKAKILGNARKTGNPELIKKCKKDHDDYAKICLRADKMNLGITVSELECR